MVGLFGDGNEPPGSLKDISERLYTANLVKEKRISTSKFQTVLKAISFLYDRPLAMSRSQKQPSSSIRSFIDHRMRIELALCRQHVG
ncbi:hypothetical protein ANN_15008 [Periplaneta americana]|uniref:Uncharacterized protein n=1 Tax=Periplaneta americana TaxID=6978 RepID=A0ABQ8SZH4_PERAM|nr:hypothetical protein ANN_15008 [Periplaneta americana]